MYNLPNKPLIVPDRIITPFSDFNSSLILQCGSDKLSLDVPVPGSRWTLLLSTVP